MRLIQQIEQAAKKLTEAGVSFGHGTTNAFDEAAWLVLWKLGLPLDTPLQGEVSINVTNTQKVEIDNLINQRIDKRQPIAYITQEVWLQGIPFYIDERSIVPRSLIAEILCSDQIDYWIHPEIKSVLDLCTGNGSLAVIAALNFPDIKIDASDISKDALEVARINLKKHQLQDRITLFEADGLLALTVQTNRCYDLILCNPPYVNSQSMANLPLEYLAEPSIALDGGIDGMRFIRKILQDAKNSLSKNGLLILEIGNERNYFDAAFPLLPAVWLETSAGEDQVLLLTQEALSNGIAI